MAHKVHCCLINFRFIGFRLILVTDENVFVRHVVVTASNILSGDQWSIITEGVERAATAVLGPVISLNSVYSHNCHQYYGDLAHIKVAARKDSTPPKNARLRHLAQQVS